MMDSRGLLLAPLGAALLALPAPAQASEKGWARASDVSRTLVVGAALGVPAVQGDWQGLKGSALALGLTGGATQLMKRALPRTRPDGSDNKSFPSGHTSISFAAAASLHKRYGWQAGLPAYALAGFTGVARVKADKHYVSDVVVGAALGTGAGWLLNGRKDDRVQWLPWGGTKGGGVEVAVRF